MQFENQININYSSVGKLRYDIKYMHRAGICQTLILVVSDEVTNYLVKNFSL